MDDHDRIAPPPRGLARLSSTEKVSGAGAIGAIVGAFLPWASVLGFSVDGIEGDGRITFVLGIVGLAALAARAGYGPVRVGRVLLLVLGLVLGGVVATIGIVDYSDFAGFGIRLTIFAGAVWVLAALYGLTRGRREKPPAEEG